MITDSGLWSGAATRVSRGQSKLFAEVVSRASQLSVPVMVVCWALAVAIITTYAFGSDASSSGRYFHIGNYIQ
jgi:hypothetical protein